MIAFSAIIFTIGLQVFLQTARTFATGIIAFAAFWTFIFKGLTAYVSIIGLILNIPLLIFSYFKNNKRFTARTSFFLIVQVSLGSLFIIDDVNELFTTNILVSEDELNNKQWAIWIMSIIGSILIGLSLSIAWMFGGSTGGTDIITHYFSLKRQKSIGFVMSTISIAILIFSFLFTILFNDTIRDRWLITLFSSSTYIFITSLLISIIYPKYKKVEVTICSNKASEISQELKRNNYGHAWSIGTKISGFSNQETQEIKTVMFLLESRDFKKYVQKIDPQAFITIQRIYSLYGNFSTKNIEDNY